MTLTAPALSPLDEVLKRSGAHMAERDGWLLAADFGSLAAELAVSRSAAGLADVSNICKLEVRGRTLSLAEVHPSGRQLRPGHAVRAVDAWWCTVSPEVLLVLSPPAGIARARARVEDRMTGGDVRIVDVTADRVAVCLTGPCATASSGRAPRPALPAACGRSRWPES